MARARSPPSSTAKGNPTPSSRAGIPNCRRTMARSILVASAKRTSTNVTPANTSMKVSSRRRSVAPVIDGPSSQPVTVNTTGAVMAH